MAERDVCSYDARVRRMQRLLAATSKKPWTEYSSSDEEETVRSELPSTSVPKATNKRQPKVCGGSGCMASTTLVFEFYQWEDGSAYCQSCYEDYVGMKFKPKAWKKVTHLAVGCPLQNPNSKKRAARKRSSVEADAVNKKAA